MPLHDNIRKLRKRKVLSQRDLAQKCGLNITTITRIETGRHEPQYGTIRKIASALEVPPEELMMERPRLPD